MNNLTKLVLENNNEVKTLKGDDAKEWMDTIIEIVKHSANAGFNPLANKKFDWKIRKKVK